MSPQLDRSIRPVRRVAAVRSPVRACALGVAAILLGVLALRPGEAALRGMRVVPEATRVSGVGFPVELWNGNERRWVRTRPLRIASIAVTGDETLAALGVEARVVGVSRFVDDPRASSAVGHYSTQVERLHGEAESILALQPDLAIVSGYTHAERVAMLEAAGTAVFRLGRPQSFAEIDETIRRLGIVVGANAKADELRSEMRSKLEAATSSVSAGPRARVLFLSWAGYTSGAGTLLDEIIERGGAHNVARDAGLKGTIPLSLELALSLQPDFILTSAGAPGAQNTVAALRDDPRWGQLDAVRTGRVLSLEGALALSTSHHAARAVAQLAAWLQLEETR